MSNVLTNGGIAKYQNAMNGGAHTPPQHVGWGVGTTDANPTDTTLETPSAESRVLGTKSLDTTNVADDTYKVVATLTCASTPKAITEVGLFNASTSGDMYVRGVFSAINLAVGDAIQFTIKQILQQPA